MRSGPPLSPRSPRRTRRRPPSRECEPPLVTLDGPRRLCASARLMLRSPLLNVMIGAARKAARALKRDFGEVEHLQVSLKGPANFVTAADRRAEETLYVELAKARP